MRIYSVLDIKAEAHLQPQFYRTKGEALRAFEAAVTDTNSQFHKFAPDYTLFELGEFDESSASIVTHAKPLLLANASEFKH